MPWMLLVIAFLFTITWWAIAWLDLGLISHASFVPLWIGYIITVNALSEIVFKESLVRRMGKSFGLLFLVSAPMWWVFEYFNETVQNWSYTSNGFEVSVWSEFIGGTLAFATVIPAVLSTTFFFQHFFRHISKKYNFRMPRFHPAVYFIVGIAFLVLVFQYPREAYPLLWIAPFFLVEPFDMLFSKRSLVKRAETGKWHAAYSLMIGTLVTGFWWECWNYYSSPKWVYTIPYVDFWKVFEMPILGFLGYLPFGLIIYSYTLLALWVVMKIEHKRRPILVPIE